MRREFAIAFVAFLAASFAAGQLAVPPVPPPLTAALPNGQTIYYAGPGVTAPTLIPITLPSLTSGKCRKFDGTIVLSAVVDTSGVPHNMSFLQRDGTDLDKLAVDVVNSDRFEPGTQNGVLANVAVSIKTEIQTCIDEHKHVNGEIDYSLHLRSMPKQQVDLQQPPSSDTAPGVQVPGQHDSGKAASAPVLLSSREAEFSDYARENHINGDCLVALIIDAKGKPQNVHVIRSLEPSLDRNAIYAVRQYHFKPAMRNGVPVPLMITVEVAFRLF